MNSQLGPDHEEEEISDSESIADLEHQLSALNLAVQSRTATSEDLREALKQSQLLNVSLLNKVRLKDQEIGHLKANQRQRARGKTNAAILPHEDDIRRKAKCFIVMHELFLDDDAFEKPKPPPMTIAEQYNTSSRLAQLQSLTLQLYDFLPEHYHELLQRYRNFGKTFQQGASAGRGSYINSLRQALPTILNMRPDLFALGNPSRHEDPSLQGLMKRDPSIKTYPLYPPILYPENADGQAAKLFHSLPLMKALKVVLFGTSVLTNPGCPKRNTNGKLWGVTTVSSGSIAFIATVVRFILSPDEKFEDVGAKSGIKYKENFAAYKELLEKGLAKPNHQGIRRLFALWNRTIFTKEQRSSTAPTIDPDSNDPEADDLLQEMDEFDNVDDDSDNNGNDGNDNSVVPPAFHNVDDDDDDLYASRIEPGPLDEDSHSPAEDVPNPLPSVPRFARSSAAAQALPRLSRSISSTSQPATVSRSTSVSNLDAPHPTPPAANPPRRSSRNQTAANEDAHVERDIPVVQGEGVRAGGASRGNGRGTGRGNGRGSGRARGRK